MHAMQPATLMTTAHDGVGASIARLDLVDALLPLCLPLDDIQWLGRSGRAFAIVVAHWTT